MPGSVQPAVCLSWSVCSLGKKGLFSRAPCGVPAPSAVVLIYQWRLSGAVSQPLARGACGHRWGWGDVETTPEQLLPTHGGMAPSCLLPSGYHDDTHPPTLGNVVTALLGGGLGGGEHSRSWEPP